jgi:hypothetical protein
MLQIFNTLSDLFTTVVDCTLEASNTCTPGINFRLFGFGVSWVCMNILLTEIIEKNVWVLNLYLTLPELLGMYQPLKHFLSG